MAGTICILTHTPSNRDAETQRQDFIVSTRSELVTTVGCRNKMWRSGASDSPYRSHRSEKAIELLGDETAATGGVWVTRTEAEGASNNCMELENHKNAFFIFPYIFTNQNSDSSVRIVTRLRARRSKNGGWTTGRGKGFSSSAKCPERVSSPYSRLLNRKRGSSAG